MRSELFTNRFADSSFAVQQQAAKKPFSRPFNAGNLNTVSNGVIMDPFYREISESGHAKRGRSAHYGTDITGPGNGDRSHTDVRRGVPVYAAIKTIIPLSDLVTVKAYDKDKGTPIDGLSLPSTGDATMESARIAVQPWIPKDSNSYGAMIGMSCIYTYPKDGTTSKFTLYVEYLHLITQDYLPKNAEGKVISAEEWANTGRGIGFGPEMKNNSDVKPDFFQGPSYSLVGYLGATETPHVHVQVAFFNEKTYSKKASIRIDPMVVVY